MSARIKNFMSRFTRDDKGDVTLEAMIVLPALLVIFAASWVYFDVMRQQSISQKANYTIGDMLSRETEMIDDTYIDNARNLLFHLTQDQGDNVDLRITVVQFNKNGNGNGAGNTGSYELVWSEARGDWSALTQADVTAYTAQMPVLAPGDQSILVETRDWYQPVLDLAGLDAFDIRTYSFNRPRFAPQLIVEGVNDGTGKQWQNNGWGNGDQDAPGGSLCNNNAENATNCDGSSTGGNGKGKKNSA